VIAATLAAGALHGWSEIDRGPAGGTVWQGKIPGDPAASAISTVYLPPPQARSGPLPLVVVLHGFPGDAWSVALGLRFADAADRAVLSGAARPFIAVMPSAALHGGEWAGPWERWLVNGVLPWTARALPVSRSRASRTLAGYSAGGYGAVDIGLRHPLLFGPLEAWSGYFRPLRDGPLRRAPPWDLGLHDPTRLLGRETPLLRRLRTRFYLSAGADDRSTLAATREFDLELERRGLRHELRVLPGGHDGRFWRAQLESALAFAVPGTA
jgi:enterochelin esterase-like enzyme